MPLQLVVLGRVTVTRRYVIVRVRLRWPHNYALIGLAQTCRRFEERVEHFRQVVRRAADDVEDVGGRSQLLPRLVQFVGEPRGLCFFAGGG